MFSCRRGRCNENPPPCRSGCRAGGDSHPPPLLPIRNQSRPRAAAGPAAGSRPQPRDGRSADRSVRGAADGYQRPLSPVQPATAAIRASASSRPSAASVASIPGLAVLPVSAARSGCATWPSLRPFVSANARSAASSAGGGEIGRRQRGGDLAQHQPRLRRQQRGRLRLHRQRQRCAPGTPRNQPVPPASSRAPSAPASARGCAPPRWRPAPGRRRCASRSSTSRVSRSSSAWRI